MTTERREIPLDAHNTRVAFRVRWFGIVPVTGHFGALQGVLSLPAGGLDEATVSVDVDPASIDTGIALRDRHLRGPRFLDIRRFPRIGFNSTRIVRQNGAVHVEGTLSLRGVDQFVIARCPVRENPGAGGTLALDGRLQLSRRRFGIGTPRGILAWSPLFGAISDDIQVEVAVIVQAIHALPALLPALGR